MASALAEREAGPVQVTDPGTSHLHAHGNDYPGDDSRSLHAHRQDHNSSKLPTFRLADVLVKKSQLQPRMQHPLSPVSSVGTILSLSRGDPCRGPPLHEKATNQNPVTPVSPEGQQHFFAPHKAADDADSQKEGSPPRDRELSSPDSADSSPTTVHPALAATRPAVSSDGRQDVHVWTKDSGLSTKQVDDSADSSSSFDGFSPITTRFKLNETVEVEIPRLARASGTPSTREWAQGQRELLLPKTLAETSSRDDRRRSRPPVSLRPLVASASGGRVPPIRSFRSSGSRKSLVLDMQPRRGSDGSSGEDTGDSTMRDRTLRALEGRSDDDYSQMTPPDSANVTPDHDNTAEIFMRIANEDVIRHALGDTGMAMTDAEGQVPSRAARSIHRRPLSIAVTTRHTTPTPQLSRRLSDQRENSQSRYTANEQSVQRIRREPSYRAASRDPRDRPIPSTEGDDDGRPQSSRASALRATPITPRNSSHDGSSEVGSAYSRRRTSITDSSYGGLQSRAAQLRTGTGAYGQGRPYNSSPLAPKPDAHRSDVQHREGSHGLEGTESSISTAAPSTVWDELDELKSRINRLETTGKLPPPLAVAMSRASDDRPATATTNATTMSASPKRGSGQSTAQADLASTTSSLKDGQPILMSALSKAQGLTSSEVFQAIESAAQDALALSSMIGAPGQPGPISSGVSTIGGSGVTDRQLRRKADSICRSLTELCLALSEENYRRRGSQGESVSPTTTTNNSNVATPRHITFLPEQSISRAHTGPARAPTSLEQRRYTMLNSFTLGSARLNLPPSSSSSIEAPDTLRKSSLGGTRRRAGTEEREEASGRKSSLLLRTRRERTEEPEESRSEPRRPSLMLRSRRDVRPDEEEAHLRDPSRAVTEVHRGAGRERGSPPSQLPSPELSGTATASSALPRRSRLFPPSQTSRLLGPTAMTTTAATTSASTTVTRRFSNRPTPDRDAPAAVRDRPGDPAQQRQYSFGSPSLLGRSGSTNRRSSLIPSGLPTPHR